MPADLKHLLQSYRAGTITRREFIKKTVLVTGSLAAAHASLDAFGLASAYGAQVDPDDPALTSSEIKFASTDGAMIGSYVTRPKGNGARPAVIVIHPWSGIDDHTRDGRTKVCQSGLCRAGA